MAYASLISLTNTIEGLVNSSRISLVPPSAETVKSAYVEVKSLREILERLDSTSKSRSRKKVNALDGRIREAVSKFEDVLESHVLNQSNAFSIDLQDLREDVDSFSKELKKMKDEYINQLNNEDQEEEDEVISSTTDGGGKMVGLSDVLSDIREALTPYLYFNVVALTGMAGIGKTAVTKEMFEDPVIVSKYPCRAWVKVGRKYRLNEIARDILAQLNPDADKMMLPEGDKEIAQKLKEILKAKTCFVVLDDIWDTSVWDHLKRAFPDKNDGKSHILLTTRLQEVAKHCTPSVAHDSRHNMRLLDKEESWDLLCKKVFGEDPCPSELEKDGKKIAEICDGLPLTIITVAGHLSKAEKTPEYWNKVAQNQNSVFMDAYDEISEVLLPSYEYLPQHLKPLFLYMGVFPLKYEIAVPKLLSLSVAEGFIGKHITVFIGKLMATNPEERAESCLEELDSNSLVVICQKSTGWWALLCTSYIKMCRLHSSMWHLCHKEARKNKFFHALNKCVDGLENHIISQRRLCFHNNVLLSLNDIHNVLRSECASTARSFLCFGPYNQFPVPICFGLKLLRVFDALQIRLHEFPVEVLELVQLRYLALTYNGKLPASISKLWNLQFLIIHRHSIIKSSRAPSYVPVEIWDMQELKHLEIIGSNLPNTKRGTSLKNLLTLVGVSPRTCTRSILQKVPNLKKLGIQIELSDDSKFFSSFNHISCLSKLESLKCVVMNPKFEIVAPPSFVPKFPSSLKKLHLSGLGYPWEHMDIIAKLPNLEVLKLRHYAFRGSKWEVKGPVFSRLRFLQIEDTDLVEWKVGFHCFNWLNCLSLKHCYKLENLQWTKFLTRVEVTDCHPSVMAFAMQMKFDDHFGTIKELCLQSSWDNVKINERLPSWSKRK